MKAYIVTEGDPWDDNAELVFTTSAHKAKVLAYQFLGGYGSIDYLALRVKRCPEGDRFAPSTPQVCRDEEILRRAWFRYEAEPRCSSCGLAEMGLKQYLVCGECDQCGECGYDADCPGFHGTKEKKEDNEMTDEMACVLAAIARGFIQACGMVAENTIRQQAGQALAYGEASFLRIIDDEHLHHADVINTLGWKK